VTNDSHLPPGRGLTVTDVAKLYRVSPDKVRSWIKRGELIAINTAAIQSAKPRFVVRPEALQQFEVSRQTTAPSKLTRRRKKTDSVDYYPD
jgi:hypothetical protein